MYEFWHIHVSISLNPCHNQGWEYRSLYRSKRKILNIFMGLKSIKYWISNIEFLRSYFCNFFCVFRRKSRFLKVKNRHFRKHRTQTIEMFGAPLLPNLGQKVPPKSAQSRQSLSCDKLRKLGKDCVNVHSEES